MNSENHAPPPDLSVIILTHNTRDLLRDCLLSIAAGVQSIIVEIIVVDNASADGTPEMMRREFPAVRNIFNQENLGFTRGNNIGIEASSGKYVLLLNSDTRILNGALDSMVRFMEENPECGILGPKLLNEDGSLQFSCRRFPSYHTALFNRYSIFTRLFPENRFSQAYLMTDESHAEIREVDWVSGAALMARRAAFEKVGLLDERFISYSEDVDWCYRMHESGWKVCFLPDAQIYHYIGRSSSKYPFRCILIRHRSMYQFYRKHYSRSIKSIDYMILLGVVLRCAWTMTAAAFRRLIRREARA